jgi:hypothetical protein
MLFRTLYNIIFLRSNAPKVPLGRWGYHWDTYKTIQKYYD